MHHIALLTQAQSRRLICSVGYTYRDHIQVIFQADFLTEPDNPNRAAAGMMKNKNIGSNHLCDVRAPVAAQNLQCACTIMPYADTWQICLNFVLENA